MQETIDFNGVKPQIDNKYLNPGMYMITPISAKMIEVGAKKTLAMEVVLVCSSANPKFDGATAKTKLWLTANGMPRLEYFHRTFYGKEIARKFESWGDVAKYFNTLMESKAGKNIKKPIAIGGNISPKTGNIFAEFPPYNYLVSEEDFTEGEFVVNSPEFSRSMTGDIKVWTPITPTDKEDFTNSTSAGKGSFWEAETTNVVAPEENEDSDNFSNSDDNSDDLPF
jgi:hypothetical protein